MIGGTLLITIVAILLCGLIERGGQTEDERVHAQQKLREGRAHAAILFQFLVLWIMALVAFCLGGGAG